MSLPSAARRICGGQATVLSFYDNKPFRMLLSCCIISRQSRFGVALVPVAYCDFSASQLRPFEVTWSLSLGQRIGLILVMQSPGNDAILHAFRTRITTISSRFMHLL